MKQRKKVHFSPLDAHLGERIELGFRSRKCVEDVEYEVEMDRDIRINCLNGRVYKASDQHKRNIGQVHKTLVRSQKVRACEIVRHEVKHENKGKRKKLLNRREFPIFIGDGKITDEFQTSIEENFSPLQGVMVVANYISDNCRSGSGRSVFLKEMRDKLKYLPKFEILKSKNMSNIQHRELSIGSHFEAPRKTTCDVGTQTDFPQQKAETREVSTQCGETQLEIKFAHQCKTQGDFETCSEFEECSLPPVEVKEQSLDRVSIDNERQPNVPFFKMGRLRPVEKETEVPHRCETAREVEVEKLNDSYDIIEFPLIKPVKVVVREKGKNYLKNQRRRAKLKERRVEEDKVETEAVERTAEEKLSLLREKRKRQRIRRKLKKLEEKTPEPLEVREEQSAEVKSSRSDIFYNRITDEKRNMKKVQYVQSIVELQYILSRIDSEDYQRKVNSRYGLGPGYIIDLARGFEVLYNNE